jgi:hypothetical protein
MNNLRWFNFAEAKSFVEVFRFNFAQAESFGEVFPHPACALSIVVYFCRSLGGLATSILQGA